MTTVTTKDRSPVDQYIRLSPQSRKHYERARRVLPAGATRSLNSWLPHPIYLRSGKGCVVRDLDGREYVDFLNNYTALILGHANPSIAAALTDHLETGTSFAFSNELEVELAERLVERIPSLEKVRFTGSGTEAVMFALRLARAFTGRSRIAKVEGGYHGTHDDAMISVRPDLQQAGPVSRPAALLEMEGVPRRVADDMLVLPFNHPDETLALLKERAAELAAVIVEPVLGVGGMVPPTPGYLSLLREFCDRHGVLLIFDEVITLRLAPGGAQELYGVTPDLTATGKVIGGGLPIGALGGRADVMGLLEPQGGNDVYDPRSGGPRLYQGGTFTGNPFTLAAGLATLEELTTAAYTELNNLGDRLRGQLARLFEELEAPVTVTGTGSLFNIHATRGPVRTFRDARHSDGVLQHALFLSLLNEGFIVAPRGMGCISRPMTKEHVDRFVAALANSLPALSAGTGSATR